MSIQHYVKKEDGWFVLENELFFYYGEILAIQANAMDELLKKHESNYNIDILNSFDLFSFVAHESLSGFPENLEVYAKNVISSIPYIPTTYFFLNEKWYESIIVNTELDGDPNNIVKDGAIAPLIISFLDLMIVCNKKIKSKECEYCRKLFFSRKENVSYCPECRPNYKKIKDEERKYTPRGKDHAIKNYLRNSQKFSSEEIIRFSEESDYYWDFIQGKPCNNKDCYRNDITTTRAYEKWLKNEHTRFKEIAKGRSKKY